jgi:transcription elongation factor Elf1
MESSSSVTCPFCATSWRVPDNYAGGTLQCPNCGARFGIAEDGILELLDELDGQNGQNGGTSEGLADQQPHANDQREVEGATPPAPSGGTPEGTAGTTRRCPSCGAQMEAGAVVCVSCGLDLRTGQRYDSVTEKASSGPRFSEEPPEANVWAIGYDQPRVPVSVVVALSILGLTILSLLLQLSQSLKLERHDSLLTDPKVIGVQTAILVVIMIGLCKGSRLAWHASRVLLILGLVLYTLLSRGVICGLAFGPLGLVSLADSPASAIHGEVSSLALGWLTSVVQQLVFIGPGLAMLIALSHRSARKYFSAVCPRCGSGAVKPADLLYHNVRCKDCGYQPGAKPEEPRIERRRMPWSVRIPVLMLALPPACVSTLRLLSALRRGSSSAGAPSVMLLTLCAVFLGLCVALYMRGRWAWHVTRWFALAMIVWQLGRTLIGAAGDATHGMAWNLSFLQFGLALAIAPPLAIFLSLGRRSARQYFESRNPG